MEYKKRYSVEEIRELVEWFRAKKDQLPASLQLDKATYIENFPQTVDYYIDVAQEHGGNSTYSGQIFTLFKMRDKLLADGLA